MPERDAEMPDDPDGKCGRIAPNTKTISRATTMTRAIILKVDGWFVGWFGWMFAADGTTGALVLALVPTVEVSTSNNDCSDLFKSLSISSPLYFFWSKRGAAAVVVYDGCRLFEHQPPYADQEQGD